MGRHGTSGLRRHRQARRRISRSKPERVRAGESLYAKHCQFCHLPPRPCLKADLAAGTFTHFTAPDPESGKRFLKVKVVDLNVIGTDPNQAIDFFGRHAVTPEPKVTGEAPSNTVRSGTAQTGSRSGYAGEAWSATISGATGLFQITSFIRAKKYEELGFWFRLEPLSLRARKQIMTRTKAEANPVRPLPVDRPGSGFRRPRRDPERRAHGPAHRRQSRLQGTAVCPGSGRPRLIFTIARSPTCIRCSCPRARRLAKFYLGSSRFDPKHVGYQTHQFPGAFELDTSKSGNLNSGHEFRNLTLEELEAKQSRTWDGRSSRQERWAFVLGVDRQRLDAMSADQRWERTREASRRALSSPAGQPIKGVLGPEFTDEERWQLVEYLKTL